MTSGPGPPSLDVATALGAFGAVPPPPPTAAIETVGEGDAVAACGAGVEGAGVVGADVTALGLGSGVAVGCGVGTGVGGAVGCGVGGAVGRGVGTGVTGTVGGGVGIGDAVATLRTITVPVMNVWKAQWYSMVPGALRVKLNVSLGFSLPLSQAEDVVVCAATPLFFQVMVSPTCTVIVCGVNMNSVMLTPAVAAGDVALATWLDASARRTTKRSSRAMRVDTIRTMPEPFAALRDEAAHVGLAISAEQAASCERFADILIERNTSVNLTAITEPVDIAHKHFLDSWTAFAARRWTGRERVVDVGSGAGFPGLALRIASPSIRVTLIESVGKKARFLEEVATALSLDDVEVRNDRAEVVGRERRERYDVATARAVGTLGHSLEYLLPLVRVGGDAIVWKGRLDHEMAGGEKAAAALGGEVARVVATSELGLGDVLPGRNLVVVRKTRATPARYPRGAAEVKRRPW